jgi:DNA-binding beta-propeller fold protein YncE
LRARPPARSRSAAVSNSASRTYVNVEDRNAIAVLDLRARRVTRTIALTGCEGPTGLALVNGGI